LVDKRISFKVRPQGQRLRSKVRHLSQPDLIHEIGYIGGGGKEILWYFDDSLG
jgi:hypothetical protein